MERKSNVEQDEIIIDVGELFSALLKKAHIILLVGIFCAVAAFFGTKLLITPKYDSVTKIYVISKQNENAVTYSDLQTGAQLTKDYVELVKSRPVLEEVISILNLDMSVGELLGSITVEVPQDTRIIKITVRHEDPKMAKNIANAVRSAASVQIKEVMNIDAVNMVEEANLPIVKATPNTMKNTVLGGMFGMILVIGIIVLILILDDTIKTPEDVEKYLELNVLASLPIKEGVKKNKKGKKSKKQKTKRNRR